MDQTKENAFTVDPDSIWTVIPEGSLTITQMEPTCADELTVTFHWISRSCGRNQADARLQPPAKDHGPRDVFLHFGQLQGERCPDMKRRSLGFTMKSLPPGLTASGRCGHPNSVKCLGAGPV